MGKKGKIWAAGTIAVLTLVILFIVTGEEKSPYPTVSEISHTWLNLKTRSFSLLSDDSSLLSDHSSLLSEFTQTVKRFADSPVGSSYQTHRSVEMRSLDNITAAADRLKTALQTRNTEAVVSNILEIDKAVDTLQRVDAELTGPSQLTFFLLFFFLSLLIIIIVIGMTILKSKLDKETQGHQRSVTFSRETVIAQEQERSHIALELHDTVAQELVALSVQTEMKKKHLALKNGIASAPKWQKGKGNSSSTSEAFAKTSYRPILNSADCPR